MMINIWDLLLNQSGGGSIDMSRGFSGFGNLPPLDWMPNPGAEHGVDVRGQFSWNAPDPYTYFRWYESLQFARAREEDRRLLLGDSAKTSRMLLAGNVSEIQLDSLVAQGLSAGTRTVVNGVEFELVVGENGFKVWREVNPLAPRSQGGQPTAPPKWTPDWLEQFAAPYPLGPASPTPPPTSPTPPPTSYLADAFFGVTFPPNSDTPAATPLIGSPIREWASPRHSTPSPVASLTEKMLYRDLEESHYSPDALNRLNKHYEEQFPLSGGNLRELLVKRAAAFATASGGQWRQGDYLDSIGNGLVAFLDMAGVTIAGGSWKETAENLAKGALIGGAISRLVAVSKAAGSLSGLTAVSKAAGDSAGMLGPQLDSALASSGIAVPRSSAATVNLQHVLRGGSGDRGIGVLTIDVSKLTPLEIESTVEAIRDMDFQAGMADGLVRTSVPSRSVANSVAALGRRTLSLGSTEAAGHLPDVAGGGSALGPIMGQPKSVNSSIGGQWGRYAPGFTFDGYSLVDRATGGFLYISHALENAPAPIPDF